MFEEDQIKQILDTLDSLNSRTRIYFGCDSIRKWKGKTGMLHTPQLLRYTKTPIVDAHYSITLQMRSIMIIMQVNPVCG